MTGFPLPLCLRLGFVRLPACKDRLPIVTGRSIHAALWHPSTTTFTPPLRGQCDMDLAAIVASHKQRTIGELLHRVNSGDDSASCRVAARTTATGTKPPPSNMSHSRMPALGTVADCWTTRELARRKAKTAFLKRLMEFRIILPKLCNINKDRRTPFGRPPSLAGITTGNMARDAATRYPTISDSTPRAEMVPRSCFHSVSHRTTLADFLNGDL